MTAFVWKWKRIVSNSSCVLVALVFYPYFSGRGGRLGLSAHEALRLGRRTTPPPPLPTLTQSAMPRGPVPDNPKAPGWQPSRLFVEASPASCKNSKRSSTRVARQHQRRPDQRDTPQDRTRSPLRDNVIK